MATATGTNTPIMAPTIRTRTLMMHKSVHALLIAVALLSSLTVAAYAQTGSQGVVGSPLGGSSGHGAPSASRGGGATVLSEDFVRMKLAPGFLVGLNILDDPDFTGSFRIDEQGDIAVPTLGTLHVAGETVSEARTQIRKKLIEDKILKDPQVDLNVQEYAAPEVTIIGEVGSPGKYTLLASRNLVDVLALAGGPTPAAGSTVEITHGSAGGQPTLIHYSRASSPRAV